MSGLAHAWVRLRSMARILSAHLTECSPKCSQSTFCVLRAWRAGRAQLGAFGVACTCWLHMATTHGFVIVRRPVQLLPRWAVAICAAGHRQHMPWLLGVLPAFKRVSGSRRHMPLVVRLHGRHLNIAALRTL